MPDTIEIPVNDDLRLTQKNSYSKRMYDAVVNGGNSIGNIQKIKQKSKNVMANNNPSNIPSTILKSGYTKLNNYYSSGSERGKKMLSRFNSNNSTNKNTYAYDSDGDENINENEKNLYNSFRNEESAKSRFILMNRESQDTLVGMDTDSDSLFSGSASTLFSNNNLKDNKLAKEVLVRNARISPIQNTSSSVTLVEENAHFEQEECLRKLRVILKKEELTSTDIRNYNIAFNHDVAFDLGKERHLHYYELPFPWRENKYIIHGYRFHDKFYQLILSVFNWYGVHNETTNIWTHMLAAFYLIYLLTVDFQKTFIVLDTEHVPATTKYIIYMFLGAGIKCMFASVFWHTFNGTTSIRLRPKFCCVDYTGITLLISASIMSAEYITLYDYPKAMSFYMILSGIFAVFGLYLNWSPKFDSPEARPLRIKFFVLLAAVGGLSFVNLVCLEGLSRAIWLFSPVTNKSVIYYIIGVFFYGSFIPERFRSDYLIDEKIPTTKELSSDVHVITTERDLHFRKNPTSTCHCIDHRVSFRSLWWVDYYCNSHSIWHIFVFLGVVGHYNAILDMATKKWLLP
ncbi:hypothetical protein TPHA_0E03120 [Tetrapisispora phaffii CBS 4417]|uniref:ADIPOR-like receptor IZH3 n=1 Tax=Tetrapisispora phaffii (strain ATCC 24235 / CBS 4417 / NBRC 1672 / NRRL Y-8282 / UCD 70-5) TaxID=1071381 RepID=G8BU24_TETPH|nr:hypothetical protein TPHA_0E03120 [Tetrapisispora phaffii CBS 4417]CCE63402.1 hypothetical protein TPHA_0E03120 [Tetrapisispora phaffii CBS 4417]